MHDTTVPAFDHERLDAYRASLDLVRLTQGSLRSPPRGSAHIADQLRRASEGIPLNIAEAQGRTGADRAQFYRYGWASTLECAAALDVLAIRGALQAATAAEARALLHRLCKMLAQLARRAGG